MYLPPYARGIIFASLAIAVLGAALLLVLTFRAVSTLSTSISNRYVFETENRADPFRLRGCIGANSWLGIDNECSARNGTDLPDPLPPHAPHLQNSVYAYVAALRGQSPNIRTFTAISGLRTPIIQGRHIDLTVERALQNQAQTTADCYTGNLEACSRCSWCNTAGNTAMYEGARARSIGLLVVNAKTGAIEAAASAFTACFARQQRAELPGIDCPHLPNQLIAHLDRLGNQAIEQAAKPGSLTKIVIALALENAGLSVSEYAALADILTYSRTLQLIDIVMCKSRNFDPACAQHRLHVIARTAHSLGLNGALVDVLSNDQLPGLRATRFGARFMSHADGTALMSPIFDRQALATCSRKAWHQCAGEPALSRVIAELFGTGDALASPVGAVNVLLQVAAANHRQTLMMHAHLIDAAQNGKGDPVLPTANRAATLTARQATAVLHRLSTSAINGTARSACIAAAKAMPNGLLPCVPNAQGRLPLRIAGKTATPVFSADQGENISLSLPQWRARCKAFADTFSENNTRQRNRHIIENELRKCNMVPTKWYAFLIGKPGATTWDRIVVVLSERNWNQQTQRIDSPNDTGSNVSAEAGLALANAIYFPKAEQ